MKLQLARRLALVGLVAMLIGFADTGTAWGQVKVPVGEIELREAKAAILQRWFQRNHAAPLASGGFHINFMNKDGKPMTSREICCEIDLLMRALRKVLGSRPDEIDTGENALHVNIGGQIAIVNLVLGSQNVPAKASGKKNEIVIALGENRAEGSGVRGQDAAANVGEQGVAITAGGNGGSTDNGKAGVSVHHWEGCMGSLRRRDAA